MKINPDTMEVTFSLQELREIRKRLCEAFDIALSGHAVGVLKPLNDATKLLHLHHLSGDP